MTAFVESRLLYFQGEVIRCIKEPAVVSRLEADSVISQNDSSRLKKLYQQGDSVKANEEMINYLQKSRAKGRWRSFLDALEQSEYHYLRSLLESKDRPCESDERAREIIRVFTPSLEKMISAKDIVTELYSRKVINDMDKQEILTTYQNKGDTYAAIVLLERMQCRLAPDEWYYEFLSTLEVKDLDNVIEQIEPDFLSCPEQFKPSADKAPQTEVEESPRTSVTASASLDYEMRDVGCTSSSHVTEHMMSDYVEAEDMDDEGVPGPAKFEECDKKGKGTSVTPVLGNFDDNYHRPLWDTRNSIENMELEQEACESTSNSRSLENAGERIPPEGQDLNVSSSGDYVVKSEKKNIPKNTRNDQHFTESSIYEAAGKEDQTGSRNTEFLSNEIDTKGSDPAGTTEDVHKLLEQKLYSYQLELAEKALTGKNTVICAPTGSGKTWVALYIIDKHLSSSKTGDKKVAFMARNGALVAQQVNRLSEELPYARVKHLVGDTEEALMMQAFIDDYDIFFFTPQILVNNLSKDVKSLSVFSLLILDECHHTKGDEPYNMLMRRYHLEKSEGTKSLPQIVGLTASIGTGRATSKKDALDHIFRVCANLDVRCLSRVERNIEDLAKHVNIPSEESIPMKKRSTDPCRGILLEAIRETKNLLSEKALLVSKLIPVLRKCPQEVESKQFGIWIANVVNIAESLQGGTGRDIVSCAKYLQIYYNALEVNRLLRVQDVAFYVATQHSQEDEQEDLLTSIEKKLLHKLKEIQKDILQVKIENPNVQVISQLLMNLFEDESQDSRAMVFVHARATSRALADFINEEFEKNFVKASQFIGKETRGTEKGMTEEEQTSVINDFREGTFKVLVATSVGMEGLDVPDCNMILNYNFTGDDITKIQMPGRSRKEGGKSYVVAEDAHLQKDKIAMYRIQLMKGAIEEFMELDSNSINRKILSIQKKELDDYKWFLKTMDLKRIKQSNENDYEIQCRKCGNVVCNASEVRKLQTSHLVALKGFEEKIKKEIYTVRANMGALKKTHKMFCKNCPNYWGVIGKKDNIDFYILKLECMKFVDSVNKEVTTYKKWIDVPYMIKDISVEDLSNIYDETGVSE